MNDAQKEAILDALKKHGEEIKYYVYALCEKRGDELIPFYIGKGQGDRVWQHEIGAVDAQERVKEIKELAKDIAGEGATETAQEEARKKAEREISAKYKRINELGADRIEKVIIKWGMTSDEAFMAESALINLLNMSNCVYPQAAKLTNVANGHASKGEKISGASDTMARGLDQFYLECAQKPLYFEDDFQEKYIKAIFISVNNSYPHCLEQTQIPVEEAIRNSARGYWRVRATNLPDYLVALYQKRIVGIYRIDGIKKILDMTDSPDSGLEEQSDEKMLIEEINNDCRNSNCSIDAISIEKLSAETIEHLKRFLGNSLAKNKTINDAFSNWIMRRYYSCKPIDEEDPLFVYLHRLVFCKDGASVIRPRSEKRYSY